MDLITVEERYMKPTEEYPLGSYLRTVGDNVEVATGCFEKDYPGRPSLHFHGGPPFTVLEAYRTAEVPAGYVKMELQQSYSLHIEPDTDPENPPE